MTLRAVAPAALVAIGGGWGVMQGSPGWTLAGALAGAAMWGAFDAVRGNKVMRWLAPAAGDDAVPEVSGFWGELVYRMRKRMRKLEKKAGKHQARLEDFLAALEASPYGVTLLDADWRIEWANPTAGAHLGFDPLRDQWQYVRNLVRFPAFAAYLDAADFSHEIQLDGPDATPSQPARVSLQIHPYGKKRKLIISRDVTALQLADAMRRDFVANVSHEIRTPLTVLFGFVETMQTLPLDDHERTRYLDLMSQQARRMQTLVSDLLTLSRLEGSPLPGVGEWMATGELLAHVLQEARGLSQAIADPPHDIAIGEGQEMRISGAKSELLSAMSNLMSNAVRYTPPGGSIRIGWRVREDGSAEFHVQDTGPGIAAEHLPRLTERFYRVDRSRSRETGGTGLGLAIVKHVAQRHGGVLDIESVAGQGSRFMLVLPAPRVKR